MLEINFSALKRLKTFLCNNMGKKPLTSLALMHTEKNIFNSAPNYLQTFEEVYMYDHNQQLSHIMCHVEQT